MAISQPSYPISTSNLVTHVGTYTDGLPTRVGRASTTALTDGLLITDGTAQASGHTFILGPRTNTGIAWPVATLQPKNSSLAMTLDIAPSSGATDNGTNGVAWIDICDTPIIDDTAGNLASLRLGMRAGAGFAEITTRKFGTGATKPLYLSSGYSGSGNPQIYLTTSGSSYIVLGFDGSDVLMGTLAAIATNSTTGFFFVPNMAGTPSGTPARYAAGRVGMVYDTTANKLWSYSGGAWKSVAFT